MTSHDRPQIQKQHNYKERKKKTVEGRKITLNIIIYRTKVPVKNKMWIELDWKDKINYLDFS